jgi:exopolyphosphatase/pppGpp-phosphohydrolase
MKNKKKILIDVGSSTVKVYKQLDEESVELLFTKSIGFKTGFEPEKGITEESLQELFNVINKIQTKYKDYTIKLYATALFRRLSCEAKLKLVDRFFLETGLYFNIVDHALENFYLEQALAGHYTKEEPIMLVNIGGGSTELVIVQHNTVLERHNLDIGIGPLLGIFPGVNSQLSEVSLKTIVGHVQEKLPTLVTEVRNAIYSGGELKYMELVGYKLQKNQLFNDNNHPAQIALKDFIEKNEEVFKQITLQSLENLMLEDPKWMHGARLCSAIAQAIFEKYEILKIVPSNSNLIDGVVRQEFRSATLSGSFRKHLDYILLVKKELTKNNISILSPRFDDPKNPGSEFVVFSGEENKSPLELERHHLDSIKQSDALIVCNPEGYVGASALIEIGYAHSIGKRIIYTERPQEFMLNTIPGEIGL